MGRHGELPRRARRRAPTLCCLSSAPRTPWWRWRWTSVMPWWPRPLLAPPAPRSLTAACPPISPCLLARRRLTCRLARTRPRRRACSPAYRRRTPRACCRRRLRALEPRLAMRSGCFLMLWCRYVWSWLADKERWDKRQGQVAGAHLWLWLA